MPTRRDVGLNSVQGGRSGDKLGVQATSWANSLSSVAPGSLVMPVCTSDGWMIVEDGATLDRLFAQLVA